MSCDELRFNWSPENVYFEKKTFMDLNINARGLFFWKLKELPGLTFLSFAFFTVVPKTDQKTVQSSKMQKNDKIVIPTWRRSYIRTTDMLIFF